MNNYFEPFNNSFLRDNNLYGPYEGYLKGNMYKNLYEQYKDYKPSVLRFNNEREEALFNIEQIQFAMHDISLSLDINPNDSDLLNTYVNYENTYNELMNEYQKKYGPININSVNNTTPFSWVSNKFPWEVN